MRRACRPGVRLALLQSPHYILNTITSRDADIITTSTTRPHSSTRGAALRCIAAALGLRPLSRGQLDPCVDQMNYASMSMALQKTMATAAVAPVTANPVENNASTPAAPPAAALWSVEKMLPAATVPPIVPCPAAAVDPAATPLAPNPTQDNNSGDKHRSTESSTTQPTTAAMTCTHLLGKKKVGPPFLWLVDSTHIMMKRQAATQAASVAYKRHRRKVTTARPMCAPSCGSSLSSASSKTLCGL